MITSFGPVALLLLPEDAVELAPGAAEVALPVAVTLADTAEEAAVSAEGALLAPPVAVALPMAEATDDAEGRTSLTLIESLGDAEAACGAAVADRVRVARMRESEGISCIVDESGRVSMETPKGLR